MGECQALQIQFLHPEHIEVRHRALLRSPMASAILADALGMEQSGSLVTSPLDPQLITEAETVKESFENARDALAALAAYRRKLIKKLADVKT
jgi:hypothetical protein